MPVEYDLVVIGDSVEGIYAATTAAYFNARVALVVSPLPQPTVSAEVIYRRTLSRIAHECYRQEAAQWELSQSCDRVRSGGHWTKAIALAHTIIATLALENSLETLATLGVDLLVGPGEFCRRPQQAFLVNHRPLRSRAYLLATGSHPIVPPIKGLPELGCLTPTDLWQQNRDQLPNSIAILGDGPIAVELAQSLRRLGKEISLILQGDRILPAEDTEAAQWIQAQLEAEGLRIFPRAPITQVRQIETQKWLQAGNKAIEADEILSAVGQAPNIDGLNLESVGVKSRSNRIETNEKLQTTNPQIYACGSLLGGYSLAHIACYEATIAVKNALFWPRFTVDYSCRPWGIFTEPNLARVGMSEAQAQHHYGKDAIAVRHYYKQLPQALILEETTGFCKLILRTNGEILGAHIVGPQATESIATIALALQNRLNVTTLLQHSHISPTLTEILHKVALQRQRDRLKRNTTLKSLRETWFRTSRNWTH